MKKEMVTDLDLTCGQWLTERHAYQSRRSFLSKVTQGVFGLLGVHVATRVLPFSVPARAVAAEAEPSDGARSGGGPRGPWSWCGLHGYVCGTGTCTGGSQGAAWAHCCKNPADNCWYCVIYQDWCGTLPPNWPNGCVGPFDPNYISWCGGTGTYICTKVIITDNGFKTKAACGCAQCPPKHP